MRALALAFCLASCATSPPPRARSVEKEEPADLWLASFAAMMRAEERAQVAEREQRFADAAVAWTTAARESKKLPSQTGIWLGVYAARAWIRASEPPRALALLEQAAKDGFRYARALESDVSLRPLREDPRFKAVLATVRDNARRYDIAHGDPDRARLVFDDVARFWRAFDLAKSKRSLSERAIVFRSHYVAPATPGLIDFHHLKTKSAERLVATIAKLQPYYEGIRAATLEARQLEPKIRRGLRRLKRVYPEGAVPDVTFVIGRLNSGGTAGPSGMLIGLDIWSWTEGVPLDGLSPGMRTLLTKSSLAMLPWVVVHEHVHTLQQYGGEPTLLREAISEGSADFIAGLALPDQPKPYYYRWGLSHEAEVWQRFRQEMDGRDTSNWIANLSRVKDGWSADLGYFVGARICEAYFARATDKPKAVRELLFVNDAKALLSKSGYAARFASPPAKE